MQSFFILFYISFLFSTKFLSLIFYHDNGDNMKINMNIVVPIICAVLLGYLCASFIFNQYGVNSLVFNENGNIYYLQCGAYTTKEASEVKIDYVEDKLTIKEDDKYYSYIGMTSDIKIAEKIRKMYEEKGVDIYIKNSYLESNDFINQLTQYDVLLDASKNLDEVNSVLKTILATYDEIILNS